MIYSVADVATKLNLKILATSDGEEWHGANPGGSGATKDGFILYPEGNAYDRKIDTRYKSFEVARLAGIEPAHYEPCIEYSNGNPNGYSNANSNGHANDSSNCHFNGHAPSNGSAPNRRHRKPRRKRPENMKRAHWKNAAFRASRWDCFM